MVNCANIDPASKSSVTCNMITISKCCSWSIVHGTTFNVYRYNILTNRYCDFMCVVFFYVFLFFVCLFVMGYVYCMKNNNTKKHLLPYYSSLKNCMVSPSPSEAPLCPNPVSNHDSLGI